MFMGVFLSVSIWAYLRRVVNATSLAAIRRRMKPIVCVTSPYQNRQLQVWAADDVGCPNWILERYARVVLLDDVGLPAPEPRKTRAQITANDPFDWIPPQLQPHT
jgi:hypothetical protein